MKRFLLMLIGLVVSYAFIYPLALKIIGYYPFGVGWKVAEKIVKKGGSALDCRKIIYPFAMPLSPSPGEQRTNCIYEYAKLTKDPSACELLMPSDYVWECLSVAEEPNIRMCWFDFGPKSPVVGRGAISVPISDCAQNPAELRESRCCELASMMYVEKKESCKQFEGGSPQLRDQCFDLLARREKDEALCSRVDNANLRSSCTVAVQTLRSQ